MSSKTSHSLKCGSYFEAEVVGCSFQEIILQPGSLLGDFLRLWGRATFLSGLCLVTPCLLGPSPEVHLRDTERSTMAINSQVCWKIYIPIHFFFLYISFEIHVCLGFSLWLWFSFLKTYSMLSRWLYYSPLTELQHNFNNLIEFEFLWRKQLNEQASNWPYIHNTPPQPRERERENKPRGNMSVAYE